MPKTWLQNKLAEFWNKSPSKDRVSLEKQCHSESWDVSLNFYLRMYDGALKLTETAHLSGADFEESKSKIIQQLEKQWLNGS